MKNLEIPYNYAIFTKLIAPNVKPYKGLWI